MGSLNDAIKYDFLKEPYDISNNDKGNVTIEYDITNNEFHIKGSGEFGNQIQPTNENSLLYFNKLLQAVGDERINESTLVIDDELELAEDSSFIFCGSPYRSFVGLEKLNTEKCKTMMGMFSGCYNLKEFAIPKWTYPNLENASFMFSMCPRLTYLNLVGFGGYKLRNISRLCKQCPNLKTVNLRKTYVVAVISVKEMFAECEKLDMIYCSDFQMENCIDFSRMFYHCYRVNFKYFKMFVPMEANTFEMLEGVKDTTPISYWFEALGEAQPVLPYRYEYDRR